MKPDPTRNARQAAHKARTLSAGGKRLNVYIGAEAKAALDRMAAGSSERLAVERALIELAAK